MRLAIVFLVCVGCGGKSAPAPSGPTCASVMPKMTEATALSIREGGADDDLVEEVRAESKRLEPQLVQACIDDGWSAELLACMDETAPAEMEKCEHLVTPEQIEAIQRIFDQASAAGP